MALRDLLVAGVMFAGLPFCFTRPWIGILFWYVIAYANPHRQTWGFASTLPFALLVAVATLAGFAFTKDRKPFVWTPEAVLLAAFWGWVTVTSVFAVYPEAAWTKWYEFSKVMLMTMLAVPLFQDRRRFRILLLVIAGSLGYYGFKGGLFALMTGGQWMVLGPRDTFIEANTELSLALNMCLPILLYLAKDERRWWLKCTLWAAFFLTMIAIPFTYSRSGVLGLVAALGVMLVGSKSRTWLIPLAVAGALVFVQFAPEKWVARIETLKAVEEDQSANLRFMAWQVSGAIALDHPLTGGGFRVLTHRETYDRYMPNYPRGFGHDAHSIYFNLLADHGVGGLVIFLALVAVTLVTLRRLRRIGRRQPELDWVASYSRMLQASLVAYLVTGLTLSAAYFDMAYQLFALVLLLRVIAAQEVARLDAATTPAPAETTTTTTTVPARRPALRVPRLLAARA